MELDDRNQQILAERKFQWNLRDDALHGPRVGDHVIHADGSEGRFTHDWDDDIQTSGRSQYSNGTFYLNRDGYASYSGGLDPAIPKNTLEFIGIRDGTFWFFDHDRPGAGRGINVWMPCRVYREQANGTQ
jgi:hypothetical protein